MIAKWSHLSDFSQLSQFREYSLSDAERRAMVVAREMRAITNLDYRQINGTDTLTASRALGHLRDLGLLTMKGAGNGTYYILGHRITERGEVASPQASLTSGAHALSGELAHHISSLSGELPRRTKSPCKGVEALPKGFQHLPDDLKNKIVSLKGRCKPSEIKSLIKTLCSIAPLELTELAQILNRDPKYLRSYFLSKMIKSGELIYQFPGQVTHPHQAYKVPKEN